MGKYSILSNNRLSKLHALRESLFVKVGLIAFEVSIFAYLRSSVCRTRHLLCPYFHKSDGKGRGHFVMLI